MVQNFSLSRSRTGLLVIDVQENLFQYVDRSCEVMQQIQTVIRGFQILKLPIYATEQYPQGLGPTVAGLKACLGPSQKYISKTTFSCLGDAAFHKSITALPQDQWVLVGIEAHVCVLQTAKDLLAAGKQVAVVNECHHIPFHL